MRRLNRWRKLQTILTLQRFLEGQCANLKIPLKWPDNLHEFNLSMKNFKEDKNRSEQNLFEEIYKDVISNATFVKNQLAILKGYEEALNRLEEQKAVVEACGAILAEQNIQPQKKLKINDDDGIQMVNIETGARKRRRDKQQTDKKNDKGNEINDELNKMMLESQLKVYGGVIAEGDVFKLYKLTYRMSRGKVAVYTKSVGKIYTNLSNPEDSKPMSVFIMVFQNSEEMCRRVERVCDGFSKYKRDIKNAFEPEERELDI